MSAHSTTAFQAPATPGFKVHKININAYYLVTYTLNIITTPTYSHPWVITPKKWPRTNHGKEKPWENGCCMKTTDQKNDTNWMPSPPVFLPPKALRHLDQRLWLRCKTIAEILDVSRDTVERRAIPWQDHPVRHCFRYKLLELSPDTDPERRYYLPDVKTFLVNPLPATQPVRLNPRFK